MSRLLRFRWSYPSSSLDPAPSAEEPSSGGAPRCAAGPSACVAFDTDAAQLCVLCSTHGEWPHMEKVNAHHHVWRLLLEHGVSTFGTNPILVREPKSYPHRTSAVRAGQLLRDADRCDAFEVRQCSEVHTLDQLLHLQEAQTARPAPRLRGPC